MKALSLSNPTALVVIGLPGSGKSFFARQFSDTFSAPVVSYDQIRHLLFEQPSYDKNELATIQSVAAIQIHELIKTQKTFIVDGGGNVRVERMDLRRDMKKAGYDMLLIWVQTDKDTARYRSMKRSARRSDDQYNLSLSAEEYDRQAKRFVPPLPTETSVVVSGKHTYATQAKIILKKLVGPREGAAETRPLAERRPAQADASGGRRPSSRDILIR